MKNLQKWENIRFYASDYLNLVYNYYSEAGISYVATYYNFDYPNSNIDKTLLDGGAYELTGDLSGNLWRKISLLPVYNSEQIQNSFTADERGFTKSESVTSFNIPTIYNMQPTPLDMIVFEEIVLNSNREKKVSLPAYRVQTFEKATNTDITFWKLNTKISDKTSDLLDNQLSGNYTFVDFEKKIYTTEDAITLFKLLRMNFNINLVDSFNERCGFYFQNK